MDTVNMNDQQALPEVNLNKEVVNVEDHINKVKNSPNKLQRRIRKKSSEESVGVETNAVDSSSCPVETKETVSVESSTPNSSYAASPQHEKKKAQKKRRQKVSEFLMEKAAGMSATACAVMEAEPVQQDSPLKTSDATVQNPQVKKSRRKKKPVGEALAESSRANLNKSREEPCISSNTCLCAAENVEMLVVKTDTSQNSPVVMTNHPVKATKKKRKQGSDVFKLKSGGTHLTPEVNQASGKLSSKCDQPGTSPKPKVENKKNGFGEKNERTVFNGSNSSFSHQVNVTGWSQKLDLKQMPSNQMNPQSSMEDDTFEEYLPPNLVQSFLQISNSYVQGAIRINQKNFKEAYISDPEGGRDIVIEGVRNRNRALEGDEVVVALFPEQYWKVASPRDRQKCGKVVFILNVVHSRQAVGYLKPMPQKNSFCALFSPRDSRVPRIRIPVHQCPPDWEKCGEHMFFARITHWDNVRFARGSLMTGSIGKQGDIETETIAILLENGIRMKPYAPEIVPQFPTELSEKDFANRQDLRKLCIFSIDPETARDLDDAVSCEILPNGNVEVGVHISDVAHFLQEGTALDKEVANAATTTYLVQSVYHMLPRELTLHCSLLPGLDKAAFSIFWELEESETEVKRVSHRFTRSVINSCAQLSYEHAQIMLENPDKVWKEGELPPIYNGFTPDKLSSVVCTLNRLARKMRNYRFKSGTLSIDQTKLVFALNKEGLPTTMKVYENKESHRLIEEFMLLANMTVAETLHDAFPRIAFLRKHDPPTQFLMEELERQLRAVGVGIDISSAGALYKTLLAHRNDGTVAGAARSIALNTLLAKPMARAAYFCIAKAQSAGEMGHYALNVPLYTHFTSPIRRYADVMVHRLLAAYMGYTSTPAWTEDYVCKIASNCNKRKFNAKKAGEQSSELYLSVYLRENGPIRGFGVVVDVKDHSFDAIFCSTGTMTRIYCNKLGATAEHVEQNGHSRIKLAWLRDDGSTEPVIQVISIFSIVPLELRSSTTQALKIEGNMFPPWFELCPQPRTPVEEELDLVSQKTNDIDLSGIELPDILDYAQECLDTSDDDCSSPDSARNSPTPLADLSLSNVEMISRCPKM